LRSWVVARHVKMMLVIIVACQRPTTPDGCAILYGCLAAIQLTFAAVIFKIMPSRMLISDMQGIILNVIMGIVAITQASPILYRYTPPVFSTVTTVSIVYVVFRALAEILEKAVIMGAMEDGAAGDAAVGAVDIATGGAIADEATVNDGKEDEEEKEKREKNQTNGNSHRAEEATAESGQHQQEMAAATTSTASASDENQPLFDPSPITGSG
jgi:hypothetical protein